MHRLHVLRQCFAIDKLALADLTGFLCIVLSLFSRSRLCRRSLRFSSCFLLQLLLFLLQLLLLLCPTTQQLTSQYATAPLLVHTHVTPDKRWDRWLVVTAQAGTLQQIHIDLVRFPQMCRAASPVGQLQSTLTASEGCSLVALGMQWQLGLVLELVGAGATLGAAVRRAEISEDPQATD